MSNSSTEPPTRDRSERMRGLSRRAFTGGVAAAISVPLLSRLTSSAAGAPRKQVPHGFGSVMNAPRLPAGFTKTFKSKFVQANGIRQHVVIGG